MSDVLERSNMLLALKRVKANKGCPGTDNISLEDIDRFLIENWRGIKIALIEGKYRPNPVKVIYIPKPKGGKRMLGIPYIVDRLIQQALLQKLSPYFDNKFSNSSFGFRPNRNAHQAVLQAREFQRRGYHFVVDIDLEKFFDKVNHDVLMGIIAKQVEDKMILKLIRRYLQAGMMEYGVEVTRTAGTPQGSPLSPLLSNILLDIYDKELELRGHKFCRYADDSLIFVKSEYSAKRVFASISKFLEERLRLKINQNKSKVRSSWGCTFLGYSFLGKKNPKIRCGNNAFLKFKWMIKQLTRGHRRMNMDERIEKLNEYIRGWCAYFKLVETGRKFEEVDMWIRTRLRMCLMKQWFYPRTRIRNLINLGMPQEEACGYGRHKRWWHYATLHHTKFCLNNKFWDQKGLKGVIRNLERFGNI